jgi:hypothetical protein
MRRSQLKPAFSCMHLIFTLPLLPGKFLGQRCRYKKISAADNYRSHLRKRMLCREAVHHALDTAR